ncbi:MAG: permease [Lachnospiraceae bacterium]|nr:permease [Lachnospiraceae bacterium]
MKNPLIRRIPRELVSDWHKYLVIIVFMVVMIGVISGMYVGHDSMLSAVYAGRDTLNLEDGSFELTQRASEELLAGIASGEKADVRGFFLEKGNAEADKEVAEAIEENLTETVKASIEETVRAQCATLGITDEQTIGEQVEAAVSENLEEALSEARASESYRQASEDAYREAHEQVAEKVDEEWEKIADKYSLEEEAQPVPVRVYEHFYRDEEEDWDCDGAPDATVRIYKSDSDVDLASFNLGRAPETDREIAIDRMHADNVGVRIGDTIRVGGRDFEVVGLLSYVNYLTLHESNTDLMFDAFGFDVAMVTPEAFDALSARVHYSYAYKYERKPADKVQQADDAESFLKALITQTVVSENELKDYLPEYLRQASNFAVTDIEGDSVGTEILCYILIGVIAFIFAITIGNTIEKESTVIGTLRASGYSKGELIRHYMAMPLIVTLIGAVLGNVLGYTAFRNLAVYLYYNSYSLPVCGLVWSKTALIKTTVIPLLLMLVINLFVIIRRLQLSPLRFLRRDLTRTKRTKARRLPRWSFLGRFRLRILFQNMPNYLVLMFGVVFIELMMCFAFGLPDSLHHYAKAAPDMMFAEYQYMLMDCRDEDGEVIRTAEPSAERFSATSLLYPKKKSSFREGMGSGGDESVTVYGITKGSAYMDLGEGTEGDEIFLSAAFAKKFGLAVGDALTLREEYENQSYSFTVAGITDYEGAVAAFLDKDSFDRIFEKDSEDFNGYFSARPIDDIDEQEIAAVITAEEITKVTVQLMHSMGAFMDVFKYALVVLAASLIYLLARIIIEKNEHAISMVKILGFNNGEIGSLYISPTALVVTLCAVVGFVIGYYLMIWVFAAFMLKMDGYFAFFMTPGSMVLAVLYLLIGYAAVSVIDFFRIRRIPLDVALRNIE